MVESRLKKSYLNARVNVLFYFITLFISFFSRKIFLDMLGADFVGLMGTLQNLLGFLNLAELGIGASIGFVLYKPLFNGDKDKIRDIISVLGYLYRNVGLIILGVGLILACFLPLIFANISIGLGVVYFAYFAFLSSALISYFINYRQTLLGADQRNYGMQSMFKDEECTFTPEGEYIGWIPQAQVDRFTKTNYPNFHRFIEKSSTAYQSAHMFNEGLGTRGEVDASDVVFIGNSYGKSYHKVIGSKSRSKGDTDYWKGAYTWFVSPVADDEDLLCYCGYIRDKEAVYIDFKKAANRQIALPERFVGKDFAIYESSEGVSCKWSETQGTISVVANEAGSCVIVF